MHTLNVLFSLKSNFLQFLFFITLMTLIACNPKLQQEHPQITKGRTIYMKYCTECHGVNGKGVKAFQSYQTIDLTKIMQRREVQDFPVVEIAKYIDGRQHAKEVGTRLMPMWGVDLAKLENQYNPDTTISNLGAMISYLITIQEY